MNETLLLQAHGMDPAVVDYGPELLRAYHLAKSLAERLEIAGLREAQRSAVELRDRIWEEWCKRSGPIDD